MSTPRLGDTKLFFLKNLHTRKNNLSLGTRFQIHSSIQTVNLTNLKFLWKMEAIESSGRKKLRIRRTRQSTGSFCSFSCSKSAKPVCGYNGITYLNKCHLQKDECKKQETIRISNSGPCQVTQPNNTQSPCHNGILNSTLCLCPPGFWADNLRGCRRCACSPSGSYDCHGKTGECKCREGFTGPDCSGCPAGEAGCSEPQALALSSMISVVIDGALGQFCLVHQDCAASSAECKGGLCHCKLGYKQQSAMACAPSPLQLCSFSPCEAGGTCQEQDGTFTCHCGKGRTGKYCQKEVQETSYTVVGFTGQSYIGIKPATNSVKRTAVELSFRTFNKEGLIFIATQKESKKGDFLSISLVGGHVEVRYDLGSGPLVLVSTQAVTLGSWHKLVFRRYHRDGMLRIDKSDPVLGRGRGRNKSLNTKGAVYVGGHPHINTTGDMAGTYKGLQGCVRNLRIRKKSIELWKGEKTAGVVPCSSHPCREGYCRHGGQCEVDQGMQRVRAVLVTTGSGGRGARRGKGKRAG